MKSGLSFEFNSSRPRFSRTKVPVVLRWVPAVFRKCSRVLLLPDNKLRKNSVSHVDHSLIPSLLTMPCSGSSVTLGPDPSGQCRGGLGPAPRCAWVSAALGVRLLALASGFDNFGNSWNIWASKVGSQYAAQHITISNTSLWDWVLPLVCWWIGVWV